MSTSIILNTLSDSQLADLLAHDAVGVIPTDTVYGLACPARSEPAVARLYGLKQRDKKPGTVIAADMEQLVSLGLKRRYMQPIAHYWPGRLSVVIPCHDLRYIHLGVGSIAVRVVADKQLADLLRQTGPLLTTSANLPGQPPATNIAEAQAYFGEAVDFYVDGGERSESKPSTIIRVVDDAIEIIRPGAVTINEQGEIK